MSGKVVQIFITPDEGGSMQEVNEVKAIKGRGLKGDRYAGDRSAWSKSGRKVVSQVSLIEQEAIERTNGKFSAAETRRNIVVSGFRLNDKVGKLFIVGGSLMKGVELCHPCRRPSKLADKEGFEEAFCGFGGLRAEILLGSIIEVGDEATSEYFCCLCNSVRQLSHDCPMTYAES